MTQCLQSNLICMNAHYSVTVSEPMDWILSKNFI